MFDFGRKVYPKFGLIIGSMMYIICLVLPIPRTASVVYELSVAPSFSLSVVVELLFIIGPMAAAGLATVLLPSTEWRLIAIALYVVISLLSLVVVLVLVGSGHSLAHLQQWRMAHKRFLQFAAGGSLIILGGFLFVDRVLGIVSYGGF